MTNPILVEVTRGARVESVHRGAFAIVDADGQLVKHAGDIRAPIYPRSAVKSMQALLLVESGAADALDFSDVELALASSSHSAEPEHVAMVEKMLESAGLSEAHLGCGAHWPSERRLLIQQAKSGVEPNQLYNNCSGKHAGFLCAGQHLGLSLKDYVSPSHQIQREIASIMHALTGFAHEHTECGVDGCSIPTHAVPLENLAHGFAKLATGRGLAPQRAAAAKRLIDAAMNEPFYIAGSRRACTKMMQTAPLRVFVKGGAEGVYGAALPQLGLGIALKIDDGGMRAAETLIPAILAHCVGKQDPAFDPLMALASSPIKNVNKAKVGAIGVSELVQNWGG